MNIECLGARASATAVVVIVLLVTATGPSWDDCRRWKAENLIKLHKSQLASQGGDACGPVHESAARRERPCSTVALMGNGKSFDTVCAASHNA